MTAVFRNNRQFPVGLILLARKYSSTRLDTFLLKSPVAENTILVFASIGASSPAAGSSLVEVLLHQVGHVKDIHLALVSENQFQFPVGIDQPSVGIL